MATGSRYDDRGAAPRHARQQQPTRRRPESRQQTQPTRRRAQPSSSDRRHAHADYSRSASPQHHNARPPQREPLSPAPFIIGGGVIVVLILVIVFVFIYPLRYDVEINGTTFTIGRGTTIGKLIDDRIVKPTPGDMLAVDGTLLESGAGETFSAVVDGVATTDPDFALERGAHAEITDGADTTEPFTETQEVIPHGTTASESDFSSYWDGALHVYEAGQDGLNVTRTGELSGRTVTEQVTPMIDSGFHIYSANVGEDKVCALTFDDGPWPETTNQILDILESVGAKATFFTIGNQIESYSDEVKRAYDMGCEVCTHSWDHAAGSGGGVNLTYMSSEEQIDEVTRGMAAIEQATGAPAPRIMRAPGGNFYGSIVETLAPYIDAEIGWEVDTEDWSRPGADAIYEAIMSVQPGQVILMHDGGGDRTQTVEALARALPELAAQGYRFITIDELLAYGH